MLLDAISPHTQVYCPWTYLNIHIYMSRCLFSHTMRKNIHSNTRLGADPFNTSIVNPSREIIPDRTLQEIVSKIFPHLKNKDEEAERRFYAQRGIQMKAEYHDAMMQEKETTTEKTNRNRLGGDDSLQAMISTDQLLDLKLEPDESPPTQVHRRLPSLRCSLLRLSGRAKIISLKKYLVMKLGLKETMSSIEILCCGESMGDDVRLSSISKTRSLPANTMLILKYRLDEGSERGTAADEGVP